MCARLSALRNVSSLAPRGGRHARGGFQMQDGRSLARNGVPWVNGRQPAALPIADAIDRQAAGVGQHDVRRQIAVLGPQGHTATQEPSTGRSGHDLAVVDQPQAASWSTLSVVIERTSVSSSATPGRVWQNLGEGHAALARRANLKGRREQVPLLLVKVNFQLAGVRLSIVTPVSSGFSSNKSIWLGPPC